MDEKGLMKEEHIDTERDSEPKNNEAERERKEWEKLHATLQNMVEESYKVYKICDEHLIKHYQDRELELPIDIAMVAEAMGIRIKYGNLNLGKENSIDNNIAQLRYELEGEEIVRRIIVHNSKTKKESEELSNLEKYAVAYELGKAIIRKETEGEEKNTRRLNLNSRPYALPRLPGRLENFEYEMCAIFLLLPLELFFEEFRKYLNKIIKHPVLIEDWIEHLSRKAGIPRYQLINGYEYIKFAAYQYYQENLSKEVKGIDYRGLFNL